MANMRTFMWSKPATQGFIKRLRDAGYTVEKLNGGYVCHHDVSAGKELVFKAMIGARGYLCSVNMGYCDGINEDIALAK